MQSFYIATFPELLKNPDMKEIKAMIKDKTGIKEENQKFRVTYENNYGDIDDISFWNCFTMEVYDISNYEADLIREIFILLKSFWI